MKSNRKVWRQEWTTTTCNKCENNCNSFIHHYHLSQPLHPLTPTHHSISHQALEAIYNLHSISVHFFWTVGGNLEYCGVPGVGLWEYLEKNQTWEHANSTEKVSVESKSQTKTKSSVWSTSQTQVLLVVRWQCLPRSWGINVKEDHPLILFL